MISGTFGSMGTTIEVIGPNRAAIERTERLFADLEGRLSRFRDDSELSRLNAAPEQRTKVSNTLAQVLEVAADLRGRTDGLVDPAVGGSVVAWGYDRTFDEIGGAGAPPLIEVGRWEISGSMLWRSRGTRLDLGGIAKGWAADEAVHNGPALVVSAGGDVASRLSDARVIVRDPWGDTPATVHLGSGGLATSSVARRRWRVGSGEAHHVIDPRSGDPAVSPVLAATVRCATAVEAEAGAKTVLIRGVDGLAWAADQPWIEAAMAVWHDRSVFGTAGWELAA